MRDERGPTSRRHGELELLEQIVTFSVQRRRVVLSIATCMVVYGIYSTLNAKLDVFPDFVQPQAVIQTESPGLSPEQVEALITRPIEGALGGVSNLESIRSQSIQGLSIITVVFIEGTDIFTARQMLTEQLSAVASELPNGAKTPKLTPLTSSTMDLLKIGLVSDRRTPMEVRTFADWTVRPRLQGVLGVASVGVMGGEVRQLQIRVNPRKLVALNVSLSDVIAAASNATGTVGAGFVETDNQRVILQTEGQSLSPETLGSAALTTTAGANLRLRDVADVVVAPEMKFGDASIQGRPGVLVKLLSQFGANTMEVTERVETALEEMKPVFEAEGIQLYPRLHRPATFIETALEHVSRSLYIGAAMVAIVLFLFLFNLRVAFISITAIPLSLLIAIIVLDRLGLTLNTITIGGLAIAIGEVVDDAIIDVENIYRRLRLNARSAEPQPSWRVVVTASLEVRTAVVYATFLVVLVFLPVMTMSGLQGRMFAPLGMAYVLAILASLVIALTVTPALAAVLLPNAATRARELRAMHHLRSFYAAMLAGLVRHTSAIVIGVVVLSLGAAVMLLRSSEEFLPEFREGHFVLQVTAVPGTSLKEMVRLGDLISNDLVAHVRIDGVPVIDTIELQVGRAELGEDPWGPHRSEFHVELKANIAGDDQADVQHQIRDRLAAYPGITFEVLTFLGDRIGETLTGETAAVVINIFGDELDVLDQKAGQIASALAAVRGAADVAVASPPGAPQLLITLRQDRLAALGFQPVEVLSAIQTSVQGVRVAQTYEGARVVDVVVLQDPATIADPESVGDFLLRSRDGVLVPLRELADLNNVTGRYMMLHDGGRRRQVVTCNVESRGLNEVVADARAAVAQIPMPAGCYAVFSGSAEAQSQARNELLLHSSIAAFGMVLLLASVFHNARSLALVLLNLPLAFVGGVLAVTMTGGIISIGSLVGFVTLFGITMRNSVMMISHYEHLVREEQVLWNLNAAIRGAGERLMPVLMTALVTGLGLLPIALGSGEVGREIEGPMAIVILGGLVTSTVLNLLVIPVLAARFLHLKKPGGIVLDI